MISINDEIREVEKARNICSIKNCRYCGECNAKIQTLKEVRELIEKKIAEEKFKVFSGSEDDRKIIIDSSNIFKDSIKKKILGENE